MGAELLGRRRGGRRGCRGCASSQEFCSVLPEVAIGRARRLARFEHVERTPDAQAVGRQSVHFDVANVPQQAIVRPEHAKAVAHIIERRVQFFHRRGGIRARRRAGGMPDARPLSQQAVDRARKSEFAVEEHRTLQRISVASALRPDDGKRGQASGRYKDRYRWNRAGSAGRCQD